MNPLCVLSMEVAYISDLAGIPRLRVPRSSTVTLVQICPCSHPLWQPYQKFQKPWMSSSEGIRPDPATTLRGYSSGRAQARGRAQIHNCPETRQAMFQTAFRASVESFNFPQASECVSSVRAQPLFLAHIHTNAPGSSALSARRFLTKLARGFSDKSEV